jgi:hypothetical protein
LHICYYLSGILIGFIKHGFLALTDIIEDRDLPFNSKNLEKHIRSVFLHGDFKFLPAGYDEMKNKEEAEKFVEISMHTFIDPKVLELRIFKIMEEITNVLPSKHPYRIIYDQNLMKNEENDGKDLIESELETNQTLEKIIDEKNIDIMNKDNLILYTDNVIIDRTYPIGSLKRPAVSLERFLRETQKRRKFSLEKYVCVA